ncbi:MFS transporter [Modestobacter sp. VKM Ac-2978]|uniref:MFS transporter n=1 Tax=Modestobacter sp. VKM Ac-2978 TaxID=3004132 RepID=UPI0022AA4FAF|nr:MFS transporter [Modestobacter sp. VKM Ac-2978]MCZ2846766.1 MFS transporter [Modestobacter sp. VKM Ac-2978]
MTDAETPVDTSLRAVFAGRRGRLLFALLLAEFAAAVQGIAYATVLPLAARELDGSRLYGATLAAGTLVSVLVLATGSGLTARLSPRTTLLVATLLYVVGVIMSATAPAMGWLLAGSAVRGLAAGLLAAFGLSALGGLFDDALRPRVMGLFSLVWLLPSLVGPPLNAAIAVWTDWRWAMAWPAAVVIVARALMGRDVDLIPWRTGRRTVAVGVGLLVVAGLVLATLASGSGRWGIPLLAGGLLLAAAGSIRVFDQATAGDRPRTWVLICFTGLVVAFFTADGLVPLAVVEGLDRSVVAGAVAIAAGLVTWSVAGARPPRPGRRPDPATLGIAALCPALAAVGLTQSGLLSPAPALALLIAAWAVAGLGMGLAYPRLTAQAFDDLAPDRVAAVATAVAFAETTAVVMGSLLGAGTYSLGTSLGAGVRPSIGAALALAVVVAVLTLAASRRRSART